MKTKDSSCNPSVTMTVTCEQAMMIWHALEMDDVKWGHYDCPPRYGQILAAIKGSIHVEHPEIYKNCFGVRPEHYSTTPSGSASPCDQPCKKCGNRNPKRQWRFRGCEMEHQLGHPETEAMLASGKIREVIYNECQCGWSWEIPVLYRVIEPGAAC
jgi:hypothetical protein